MEKTGRNDRCPCGSGKKYKKCCLQKDEKKRNLKQRVMKFSRRDLISGPYKNCPNPHCLGEESFGVFTPIGDHKSYMRECIKCGYKKNIDLPKIKKKVLYLDQFVISNLIKLLDKTHPSHEKIKADPFWEKLFTKLEVASKSQAIICPDSFYHNDESLVGGIDFRLMRRLYEHFSSGKTLYPSAIIEKNQLSQHFNGWLEGKKVSFEFDPKNITFESDLHGWSIGLRISVKGNPYDGQIEGIKKSNKTTVDQFKIIWSGWQNRKNSFLEIVKEETLGLGKGMIGAVTQFAERRRKLMAKVEAGEDYTLDLDSIFPPMSNDTLNELFSVARSKGLSEDQIPKITLKYLNDADALLEIPAVRISSVMFAGLANLASNGKKHPPKSTVDVQFISSYLPYCDALFVDKESAHVLNEFPKNTSENLRLKEFSSKVFSLNNKNDFLVYLDKLVSEIPQEQINILKDIEGENYNKPYWNIIEHEKRELDDTTN
ncbi:MAG: SEC-C metal-binding domain-containing protein [bacterium]